MMTRVIEVLAELLRTTPDPTSLIECDHNHVRREVHASNALWVHRKGAMPAEAGAMGVIPGSMGSASYHVEGRGMESALCSSAHGAGRVMSRSEARRRISVRALEEEMRGVHYDRRIAHRLPEESPSAYKDISKVMRAQRDLVRIVRRLRPLLVYKGT
jgi:tRNA-splicing ligase RtcB